MKNIRVFYLKIFSFLELKFSIYLNRRVFVMSGITFMSSFAFLHTKSLLKKGSALKGDNFFLLEYDTFSKRNKIILIMLSLLKVCLFLSVPNVLLLQTI